MNTNTMPQRAKNLEVISLTQELTRFRKLLEAEAGEPIQDIEISAALFLSDLCVFLGLGKLQHDQILGWEALDFLTAVITAPITLAKRSDDQRI